MKYRHPTFSPQNAILNSLLLAREKEKSSDVSLNRSAVKLKKQNRKLHGTCNGYEEGSCLKCAILRLERS